jgi:hypothetical protein
MRLIYWIAVGAILGFYYGWRQMAARTAKARAIIDSVPAHTKEERYHRAYAIGRSDSYRLVAALISALAGSLIGAALWGTASALVWAVE